MRYGRKGTFKHSDIAAVYSGFVEGRSGHHDNGQCDLRYMVRISHHSFSSFLDCHDFTEGPQ